MRGMKYAALAVFAAGAALLGVTVPAKAALISGTMNGNDCVGWANEFGNGFDACVVWADQDGQATEISPVISKFDQEGNVQTATGFPSIDGTEWTFDEPITTVDDTSGSWTYNPGPDDPGIRYWSVKHGDQFTLFFDVDDASLCTDAFSFECLSSANVVTSGDWSVSINSLSHIVFYDTEPARQVPLPASLMLFGIGLLGLGLATRKKG